MKEVRGSRRGHEVEITPMNPASKKYVKMVEWSEEDHCYIGICPGLFFGGCQGENEKEVFAQLCDLVDDVIEVHEKDNLPLPRATAGTDFSNKIILLSVD